MKDKKEIDELQCWPPLYLDALRPAAAIRYWLRGCWNTARMKLRRWWRWFREELIP